VGLGLLPASPYKQFGSPFALLQQLRLCSACGALHTERNHLVNGKRLLHVDPALLQFRTTILRRWHIPDQPISGNGKVRLSRDR
jgi:hypothetical protein